MISLKKHGVFRVFLDNIVQVIWVPVEIRELLGGRTWFSVEDEKFVETVNATPEADGGGVGV